MTTEGIMIEDAVIETDKGFAVIIGKILVWFDKQDEK